LGSVESRCEFEWVEFARPRRALFANLLVAQWASRGYEAEARRLSDGCFQVRVLLPKRTLPVADSKTPECGCHFRGDDFEPCSFHLGVNA